MDRSRAFSSSIIQGQDQFPMNPPPSFGLSRSFVPNNVPSFNSSRSINQIPFTTSMSGGLNMMNVPLNTPNVLVRDSIPMVIPKDYSPDTTIYGRIPRGKYFH